MASSKPPCKYGGKCYRKNPDHLRMFSHPTSPNNQQKSDDEDETNDTSEETALTIVSSDDKQNKGKGLKTKALADSESIPKRRRTKNETTENENSDDEKALENVKGTDEEEERSLDKEEPPLSPEDVKENIKSKFLVEMPEDFYQFWDFCGTLNKHCPEDALKVLKLKLGGPYDILNDKHKTVRKNKSGRRPNFLLHHRFYYDPPEFQTVLLSQDNDKLHFGYFRDDPTEKPVFVASNSPGSVNGKEKVTPCGENLFAAVQLYASKMLKTATPGDKMLIQKLIKSIEKTAEKLNLDLSASTKRIKERQKKVVCPSFHGAGIVVPVDDNEIGYRPVPETPGDLKAMFRKISQAKTEEVKDRHMEELQELITLVQFANDECDYGEGLELGMDLFSFGGTVFHPQISILLPLAYQLLNRSEFASIITAHLDRRRKVDQCVDELAV